MRQNAVARTDELRQQSTYNRIEEGTDPEVVRRACPHCACDVTYALSDGRRKCKQCRKKFTFQRRTQKLADSVLREIACMFWNLVSADRAAADLGVNRKTVLRHFNRIRCAIAEESRRRRRRLVDEFGICELAGASTQVVGVTCYGATQSVRSRIPVFRLIYHSGQVAVFLPSDLTEALNGGAPPDDSQNHVRARWPALLLHQRSSNSAFTSKQGKSSTHSLIDTKLFLEITDRCAKAYRAAFTKNIQLAMREIEFRYNRRRDAGVVDHVFDLVKSSGAAGTVLTVEGCPSEKQYGS